MVPISRRAITKSLAGAAATAAVSPFLGQAATQSNAFLWGVATSAHQVEGNNTNSDAWLMEHLPLGFFKEPSGDACDHYHRYAEDAALFGKLGFNAYRFSIEWARVEPAKGEVSRAELDHYLRLCEACRANGIAPWITLHHFTSPLWFAREGGFERPEAADLFAAYCRRVAQHLGKAAAGFFTINEINLPPEILRYKQTLFPQFDAMLAKVRQQTGAPAFSSFLMGDATKTGPILMRAHAQAVRAIKEVLPGTPVGMTLALRDHQSVAGGEEKLRAIEQTDYLPYFELAQSDDFIAVQSYSRVRVGAAGELPPDQSAERTQNGWEFYPEALEETIRYTAKHTNKPIYVSENGLATGDDTRRIEYIRRAVAGMNRCRSEKIDVRGYFHWSAFDNFEWNSGYGPHFGLIAVDRETFARSPKPSATYLGNIARGGVV